MAPIRRYLRISKYSVLGCRIYLEDPSDTRWLLDSRDPVLPRIFAAIRPLVIPKLREENERLFARKKGRPVKDVIAEEDFEVALFLRESRTRHSLLTRHKSFGEPGDTHTRTGSNTGNGGQFDTGILVESDSESEMNMDDIPQDDASEEEGNTSEGQRAKRKRDEPLNKALEEDKKLHFNTNYEGFNIYGWMLCLLVTRKGDRGKARTAIAEPKRQVLMEEWISTQAQGDLDEE
ncbi:hypothetical protein BDW59DRAFT_148504 [Aspergillus cavernicola]|uniref:Uncharacterized protein n=1 Tax=Aspergillus cavernicola TaxID=176166 RepID=A0ABR4IA22_9EURO